MSEKSQPSLVDRIFNPWWGKIAIGCLLWFIAWSQYGKLDDLESGRVESLYVGRSTKIAYELGGKWGAVGVTVAVGTAIAAWGVVQVTGKKE